VAVFVVVMFYYLQEAVWGHEVQKWNSSIALFYTTSSQNAIKLSGVCLVWWGVFVIDDSCTESVIPN